MLEEEMRKHQEMMDAVNRIIAEKKEKENTSKPKFCSNCGAPVSGGKFCGNCGNALN